VSNDGKNVFHQMLNRTYILQSQRANQMAFEEMLKHSRERMKKVKDYLTPNKYVVSDIQREHLEQEKKNLVLQIERYEQRLKSKMTDIQRDYKKKVLTRFYSHVKTESLKLKIGSRLLKIDSHQAEYLIFHYMFATLEMRIILAANEENRMVYPHFSTADFMTFYENLPSQIIPEYRKQRPYISSILSKNELLRVDKYNKKLFTRLNQGEYIINPQVELWVEEEWINVYELINIEDLKQRHQQQLNYFFRAFEYAKIKAGKTNT
jgi:hypothetical protein